MENSLLITLGHNSSAMFISHNTRTVIGYEQERLDGIKSSSRFPQDAINEIIKNVGHQTLEGCKIFISHWFDTNMDACKFKYMTELDYENLQYISTDITMVNKSFTHHDAHAYSGFAFFNHFYNKSHSKIRGNSKVYTIVADGFGNDQEVISLYDMGNNNQELVFRLHGYKYSLGLMYQYATDFCGMKMNQDEYKFLGYEPMVSDYLVPTEIRSINDVIKNTVDSLLTGLHEKTEPITSRHGNSKDPIDVAALNTVKREWHKGFEDVLNMLNVTDKHSTKSRVIIAYLIQQTIEQYMVRFLKFFYIDNVIVTGGIFYNVKLNNVVLNTVKGLFCATPLAGDQGAAIGMYVNASHSKSFNFSTLKIGKRNLSEMSRKSSLGTTVLNIHDDKDYGEAVSLVAHAVMDNKIVNIVSGDMEFGPRALCNTTSLFLPTKELVAQNNKTNRRNEVMPCAPVIKAENGGIFFDKEELDRVVGSDKFMICAHDYTHNYYNDLLMGDKINSLFLSTYGGVAHKKTLTEATYTGRPQFVEKGEFVWHVLDFIERHLCGPKALVNTSFNAHGRPIVFDVMDIVHNFNFQYENAVEMDMATATVGENGKKIPMLIILNIK